MKNKYILLLILVLGVLSCERESTVVPSINLIQSSNCKTHEPQTPVKQALETDCIQYVWVTGDTLQIKHVNAGFNCCPEGFNVTLNVSGDTLIIKETENSSLCDCCCLFDLDYVLTGITRKAWWIRIDEPYLKQGDDPMLFRINLNEATQNEVCYTRTGYPWSL